ncbi:hypothetical protein F4861DRAFT_544594, partial [Xylaria intraflava]
TGPTPDIQQSIERDRIPTSSYEPPVPPAGTSYAGPSVPAHPTYERPGGRPHFQPVLEYPVPNAPPRAPIPPQTIRTTPDPAVQSVQFDLPPTRIVRNGPLSPDKFTAFQKTWKKERNYTGKPYDLLYDKTRLFIDVCRRLEITEEQYHAVFPSILEGRAEDFFIYNIGVDKTWSEIYRTMDMHFNTNTNHGQYWADWTTITFVRTREENPDVAPIEALELMIDKLSKAQRALGAEYQGEIQLSTTIARACRGVSAFNTALIFQKPSCEAFFADLRACLRVATDTASEQYSYDSNDTYFTDRRYNNSRTRQQRPEFPSRSMPFRPRSQSKLPYRTTKKRCFVCGKEGCWSTNHTPQDRARAKNQYFNSHDMIHDETPSAEEFAAYLVEFEGYPDESYDNEEESCDSDEDKETAEKSAQFLMDNAFLHRTTGQDIWGCQAQIPADQFVLDDLYRTEYQGELWDTGASSFSTVGKAQLEAYLRLNPRTKLLSVPYE